ncbi:probable multidrug resistance-associated protein lethal(2)03659 [Copidosoma floridanum]|uniref:probable multidrug resistance-associated protein lethal(2)03659 n=1 Tax=Copidosoma floridanum TaxID=29053 RepID=UPI0006C9867A|nr:probable multidrug resistance-associated protein lethal(2)03659 [Copidosoma floridanum]XP_014214763.1 probable multidrug resistance-associated protein lethal(2)03659 [Copidosoma floridanum]
MEKNEKQDVKNPRQGANFLSAITFKWLFGTYLTGYRRELEETDLYSPLHEHSSRYLGNKISRYWQKELDRCEKSHAKRKPSLFRVLVRCFGCDVMMIGLCLGFLEFCIRTSQPIILANLLKYFKKDSEMEQSTALIWGTGIVVGVFLDCLISHPAGQGLMHIGMKIRVACCSLIYRKLLKISKVVSEGETSVGQMINLVSNDVNRLDYSCFTLHYIWIAPVQTILVSYLLVRKVHIAALGGILTLLIFIPVHGGYGKLISRLTKKFAFRTDERLRLTNEIISGVKVIKMYAWEKPFYFLIDKAREKEVKTIRNNLMSTEICWSFESYIPKICIFVTILAYILIGKDIDAEKVYLITAYYNVLRTSLYRLFPLSIKEIAEALVSIKRIQNFMLSEEIQPKLTINNDKIVTEAHKNIAISLKNVTAKWNLQSKHEALREVTFEITPGSLTAIVGQVGAGKSTLFNTILSEICPIDGDVKVNGKISYSCQEPWLFTSTIRQNILFGQPMDKQRYEKVINVCQLKRDFQLLPYGDNTLVGEKGHNLSGGQCARVNLARAIYFNADIYLLDDPLSAVDTHVGKGVFEDCIKAFLKEKTVVLITHQFHFLKNVDKIIVLSNGTVQAEGTYNELLNSGLDLLQDENGSSEINDKVETPTKENVTLIKSAMAEDEEEELTESRTQGKINLKTYLRYFGASKSILLVILVSAVTIATQTASTGADYFINDWVKWEEEKGSNLSISAGDSLRGRSYYIYFYASITVVTVIFTLLEAYSFFYMSMRISRNLHAQMFNSIVNTTMAFFNANSIGRIMNRFSKDIGIVDTRIPQTVVDVTQIALYTIAVNLLVAIVDVWFVIPAVFIGIIAYYFRSFYIKASRSIKRLEGMTRSPVVNHLSASIHGITTIRAFGAEGILTKEFDNHQDLHSSAWFIFFSGSRAFGMYIELLCMTFIAIIVYTLLIINDLTRAGDVGLVVTQTILLSGMLQWGVRQTTELESQMTSVERVLEYSHLPPEPMLKRTPENKAPDHWPIKGCIKFEDVSLTYDRQELPALNNLNFTVQSNEMIGIVGRTGAGKSSIINAIFRLADVTGEIYIDDVATSKIALQDLRSKISIIPQEPVLFTGTLRKNLDPFEEYSDHVLWQALEDVELKGFLDSDLGLQMLVMEGGSNFSVGQRQLLCLARAIVRNNKIFVLDEATANVDPHTDELIQKAVRKKFENCTVLIIAHRLNTVMDSHKILVMDGGKIVEFDHPYNLLQNKDGVFYNMVKQTGPAMAENLCEIAESNYESHISIRL